MLKTAQKGMSQKGLIVHSILHLHQVKWAKQLGPSCDFDWRQAPIDPTALGQWVHVKDNGTCLKNRHKTHQTLENAINLLTQLRAFTKHRDCRQSSSDLQLGQLQSFTFERLIRMINWPHLEICSICIGKAYRLAKGLTSQITNLWVHTALTNTR